MSIDAPPPTTTKGVSPGRDAWRRLRKSRVAMLCLAILVTIAALAFVTPLLPLQPPDKIATQLKFESPTCTPLWAKSFELKLPTSDSAATDVASIQRPYRDAGFARLNWLSRWMVRTRCQLFGDWSLASVC